MGKAVIIVLLGVIVIYGVTNLVINKNIGEMSEGSINTYMQTKARNLGNSTVEILKARVAANFYYRATSPESISLDGGEVTYRVVDTLYNGENLIKLDILSNYIDAYKKIDAFLKVRNNVPPYFSKGVCGENEVTFNGDQLAVKDTNQPLLNADVHSNTLVKLDGSNYLYEGFITSAGNISVGGSNIVVTPNYNPLGLPAMQQNVPPVTIPNFVAATYLPKATTVYNSDHTFNGPIILGDYNTPKIIYVKGKATFNATTVTGYGLIIAEKEVNIYSSVKITDPHPIWSQFGIFTNEKVNVNTNNVTVEATLFSQNESVLNNQDINIIGSMTSKNKITFNGLRDKLYYKPPSDAIARLIFGIPYLRPVIAYWYE